MEQELLKLILVEIREMKEDVSELKTTVNSMSERLTNVDNRLKNVEKDVKDLKEMSEFHTENIEAIKNVVTNNYMEFKKFVKANTTQHNLYNTKLLKFDKEN